MKMTARGVAAVAVIIIPSFTFCFVISWIPVVLALLVKYTFGERAAKPFYLLLIRVSSNTSAMWMRLAAAVLELIIGTRLAYTVVNASGIDDLPAYLTNGRPDLAKVMTPPRTRGKSKIIICNHHCRPDWLYLYLFFTRSALAESFRVVLKSELKNIPLMGWQMQAFRFLLLTRQWGKDEAYLNTMLAFARDFHDSQSILIFPEGTDLSATNIEKSNAFARGEGLPEYHHVLTPRTTGLVAMKNMIGVENIEEVIDLTVGYTYFKPGERPSEPSFVNGRNAPKVHLLVQRFAFDNRGVSAPEGNRIPIDDEGFAAWIHKRFAEKEQLLSRFYRTNPVGFDAADVKAVLGASQGIATYDEDAVIMQHPERSKLLRYTEQLGWLHGVFLQLAYWGIPTFLFFYRGSFWRTAVVLLLAVGIQFSLRRIGGLQRLLFLTKVSDDATLWARLMRKLRGEHASSS